MNLAQALRLVKPYALPASPGKAAPESRQGARIQDHTEPVTSVALVGAGGKTTALFELARQLPPPVFIAPTTHLGTWQLGQADEHHIVATEADLNHIFEAELESVVLLTGELGERERFTGIKSELMPGLHELVRSRGKFLLIEADGSRQRPLKAPGEHEPVIPDFVELVILVMGLSGLGQTLGEAWVHRPERFAELSGMSWGDQITLESLARVMTHPRGGLKSIPPMARRVALLNQADTEALQESAQELASLLAPIYHAVVVSSLERSQIHAVHEPTAGIVLAAGGASRMGKPKQLLPWHGEPLVWHATTTAVNAGLAPVCVVVGAYEEQVRAALSNLPVRFVRNTAWESGQSSSLKAGLAALTEQTGSAVFLLADQPKVTVSLIRTLVERHAQTLAPVLAPLIEGQRANPVLFDRLTFDELMGVQGDVGGRAIFSSFPITWVEWYDPGTGMDVDTAADYQKLLDSDLEGNR